MTELKERILAAAAKAPSPSRTAMRRRLVLLIAGGAGAMAAIYWMLALHIFVWQGVPRSLILAGGTLLGAASVAAMAVAIAVGRGRDMLGRSRRWLIALIVLAPLALLAWKICWSAIFGNLDESPHLGFRCLWMATATGVVPFAMLSMTRRAADPRPPPPGPPGRRHGRCRRCVWLGAHRSLVPGRRYHSPAARPPAASRSARAPRGHRGQRGAQGSLKSVSVRPEDGSGG